MASRDSQGHTVVGRRLEEVKLQEGRRGMFYDEVWRAVKDFATNEGVRSAEEVKAIGTYKENQLKYIGVRYEGDAPHYFPHFFFLVMSPGGRNSQHLPGSSMALRSRLPIRRQDSRYEATAGRITGHFIKVESHVRFVLEEVETEPSLQGSDHVGDTWQWDRIEEQGLSTFEKLLRAGEEARLSKYCLITFLSSQDLRDGANMSQVVDAKELGHHRFEAVRRSYRAQVLKNQQA